MMGKKRKKGKINEDDTIKTMSRYGATTILTLLQEVAQSADVKIDWKTIVTRSSTGISNPREYQLLWRHLAYREPLSEEIDGAEPTDDDSDLEFELETDPSVSAEVTSQAQECVKALLSTRFSSVSGPPNNYAVKVPIVLETSNGLASNTTPSDKEVAAPASVKNTTPVSLPKQTAPTHVSLHNMTASTGPAAKGFEGNEAGVGSANRNRRVEGFDGRANRNRRVEGFDGNDTAGASSAAQKKRKLWTEEEDAELIAAVQRSGEGNWVTVVKEYFIHDRTASQLSKRWSILKKRRLSTSNTSRSSNSISLAMSGVLDATRLAINNALGKPMARSYSVTNAAETGPTQSVTPPKIINPFSPIVPDALRRPSPPQKPNLLQETRRTVQEASDILQETPNHGKGNVIPSSIPRSTPKRPPASVKPKTKRTVQEASVMLQETPNQVAPEKGNVTPSSKPQITPKQPLASVKPETKRTVQEASAIVQKTPNQAAPEKGNVTPSSKPQSTPKLPPASVKPENKGTAQEASDILQEIPNQAAPEKGNVTPSSKPLGTSKRPPASVRPPIITTSSLIKAAALAAGARIVAPSAPASLLQTAQSKNIIHIRAGGSQLTSTVSRGRQQANACSPLPFRMPPPSGYSLMMSNRGTVPSHKRGDSSKTTLKGPATRAQQSSSSPANAEKMCGKEICASNGDGGLSTGVAKGAGATKSDSVLNQDRMNSLEAGEKDSRIERDVNVTV